MDGIPPPSSTSTEPASAVQEMNERARLQRELDATRALLDATRASLQLQGLRGDGLQAGLDGAHHRIGELQRSVSWRLTTPLRYIRAFAAGRLPTGHSFAEAAARLAEIAATEGAAGLGRRTKRLLPNPVTPWRRRRSSRAARFAGGTPATGDPADALIHPHAASRPAAEPAFLKPSILIVAELAVPQCAKYRVWQKQELLRSLGWSCRVVSWRDIDHATTALQLCSAVIFYRVPGEPAVLAMIDEAHRLGLDPWWEVDDLIFDETLYGRNSNLAALEPKLRRELLAGVRLYRTAMLRCGRAIASTARLADCMRDAGILRTDVIENALDAETLEIAAGLRDRLAAPDGGPGEDGPVTIVYGSGTRTHDADFACAAPAILALMRRHPRLHLQIVGDLTLPDGFAAFGGRVQELSGTGYRAYLGLLAEGHIAVAPLEATVFNDAKSNIKFQEAAILAIPSVCSPRQAFSEVIRPGINGLLAETTAEWQAALERLILDAPLRRRLGEQALVDVLARYAPDRIAREQVARLAGRPTTPPRQALRILSANIFFPPQSFGGATIVAQEMASRLDGADGVELCVFTSRPSIPGRPNSLLRYDWKTIPVFATSLASSGDQVVQLDNPSMVTTFAHVLDAVQPDMVHAHSIQGFGAAILRLCQERGIPYVVTLHDAWWLCDRQFMVRGDNRYCFQTRIDLRVCQACLPAARHLDERMRIMMGVLAGASLLLSPSESHRRLYLANGLDAARLRVNRNGIRLPTTPRTPRGPGAAVRFGVVSGAEAIKGFHLVKAVFETLDSSDWELVLVDSTLNLGFRSIDVSAWRARGTITVVPAYSQDGLDAFFDGIDVLLFPSQWKESFGLSVREALARDVWVITTAGGGQADDIEDGVNGRLIPLDGRPDGLRDAVLELLADPQRLDGYRNPHASSIASYDTQAAELLAMLREVALSHDASGAASGLLPADPG